MEWRYNLIVGLVVGSSGMKAAFFGNANDTPQCRAVEKSHFANSPTSFMKPHFLQIRAPIKCASPNLIHFSKKGDFLEINEAQAEREFVAESEITNTSDSFTENDPASKFLDFFGDPMIDVSDCATTIED